MQADYASVVDYLSKGLPRATRRGRRSRLLADIPQKSLSTCMHASMLAEKRAKEDMRRAQNDLAMAVKDINTKESFHSTMLNNYCTTSAVEKNSLRRQSGPIEQNDCKSPSRNRRDECCACSKRINAASAHPGLEDGKRGRCGDKWTS